MVDLLSWYIMLWSTVYPCPPIKCFLQNHLPKSTIRSDWFSFSWYFYIQFLFLDILITAPSPRVVIAPLCPFHSLCILYDTSNHNFNIDSESTLMVSFIFFYPSGTSNTSLISSSFPRLVSLLSLLKCECCIISLLRLGTIYNSCTIVRLKDTASSSGICTASDSSLILNKLPPDRDVAMAPIFSVND